MRTEFYTKMTTVVFIALIFTSCASIVSKSHYPLTVSTNPAEARIEIRDKKGQTIYDGSTPAVVNLPAGQGYFSRSEYFVHISMDGYEKAIIPVYFSLDGWYFGNLLFGGILGMFIVDPITGAMWKLETPFIHHNLASTPQGQSEGRLQLRVLDIADVPENMKGQLIPIYPERQTE